MANKYPHELSGQSIDLNDIMVVQNGVSGMVGKNTVQELRDFIASSLGAGTTEVHVGTTAPTNGEKLWLDTSATPAVLKLDPNNDGNWADAVSVAGAGTAEIHKGATAPTNGEKLWLDTSTTPHTLKIDPNGDGNWADAVSVAGAGTDEIHKGATAPTNGEKLWLDTSTTPAVLKLDPNGDGNWADATAASLSEEDKAKLSSITPVSTVLTHSPAVAGDVTSNTPGDKVLDSDGKSYVVATVGGIKTPLPLNSSGAVEVNGNPSTMGITEGLNSGQVVVDTSTTPDKSYVYNKDGTFKELGAGGAVSFPTSSPASATVTPSTLTADPTVPSASGSGTVSIPTVSAAPTSTTQGNVGKLVKYTNDCYLMTSYTPATGNPVGPFSIIATVGYSPRGVAIDPSGNAWVANYNSQNVTKLSPTGTTLGTYSVGSGPWGIAIDPSGNVWVANYNSHTVTKLSPTGTTLGTYSVGDYPHYVAIDPSGNVWVANYGSHNVTKLSPTGTTLGTYSAGNNPWGIAIDPSGNAWVTNYYSHTVTKLSPTGTTLGTYSVGNNPTGIAIDQSGNALVANFNYNSVTKLSPTGTTLDTYSVGGGPKEIDIDQSGNMWVTNHLSNTVTKLSPTGTTLGTYSVGNGAYGIAIDQSGNVWVANENSNNVSKSSNDGSGTPASYTWDILNPCPSTVANISVSAPTPNDDTGDGYTVGSTWVDTTADGSSSEGVYRATSVSAGSATWVNVTALSDTTYVPAGSPYPGVAGKIGTHSSHQYTATATNTWSETTASLAANISTSAPTANDDTGDGYVIGSTWVQTNADGSSVVAVFRATSVSAGSATWVDVTTLSDTTYTPAVVYAVGEKRYVIATYNGTSWEQSLGAIVS